MAKTTQQRRNEIYRIIVSQGSARVSELAEQLQVTTETIRKDLNSMELGFLCKYLYKFFSFSNCAYIIKHFYTNAI